MEQGGNAQRFRARSGVDTRATAALKKRPSIVARAWATGDFSRSGRCTLVRGVKPAYLAGGVLQLLIAQLRRHIVLLSQR
jgi:hypothetical protein